jgi:predicted PurR-regulated permease PerM
VRNAALAALGFAVVAGCAFVLVRADLVVFALFGAIVVAESLRPAVEALSTRVPRDLAVALVFAATGAVLAALWLWPLSALVPQLRTVGTALAALVTTLSPSIPASAASAFFATLFAAQQAVAQGAGTLALVFVMALFWFGASTKLRSVVLGRLPAARRAPADQLFTDVSGRLRLYVLGTLVNGAIVGVLSAIALAAVHAPVPIALGAVQGVLSGLPYLGPAAGVLIAGAVTYASQGPVRGAEVLALVAIVGSVVGTFVPPLIFGRRLSLDPLGVMLATTIGGTVFGVAGVLLAVPALAVAQTIVPAALSRSEPSRLAPPP